MWARRPLLADAGLLLDRLGFPTPIAGAVDAAVGDFLLLVGVVLAQVRRGALDTHVQFFVDGADRRVD